MWTMRLAVGLVVAGLFGGSLTASRGEDAQRLTRADVEKTIGELSNWGRWGKQDELGTLNHVSHEKTRQAVNLVQDGVTVQCARPILFDDGKDSSRPPQHFMISSGEPYRPGDGGPDRQVAIDYFGLVFHGHSVSHLDSPAHFFWDGMMYNGHLSTEVTAQSGALKGSVDVARGGIVSRGVLVDVPSLRGVDWIEPGDGVGLDDIAKAEEQCGFRVEGGDVLLLRTGQYRHWLERGAATSGSTGPKPEILPFLRERDVAVLGSDTGNDVNPSGYERFTNPVHQVGIVSLGLWIFDNANLEELATKCHERRRWEFLINILPLRLTNTTGSPATPVAVF